VAPLLVSLVLAVWMFVMFMHLCVLRFFVVVSDSPRRLLSS